MLTALAASAPAPPIAPARSPIQSQDKDSSSGTGDFKNVLEAIPVSQDDHKQQAAPVDQKTNDQKTKDVVPNTPARAAALIEAALASAISPAPGAQVDVTKDGKQKGEDPKDGKIRKGSSPNENEKTAVAATLPPHGPVLAKAPMSLLPSFGIAEAVPVDVDPFAETAPQLTTGATALNGLIEQAQTDAPPVAPSAPVPDVSVPVGEKLAFAIQLKPTDPATLASQRASETPIGRGPTFREATQQLADALSAPDAGIGKDPAPPEMARRDGGPETIQPPREVPAGTALDLHSMAVPPDPSGPVHSTPSRGFAIQDVQPVLPEIPKPPTSTEILLHLGAKDQSTASVRMVDRAGTVNVSVHASDPDLRSSLRSNLSDLASQLTGQGFKTELVRPAVIAANTNNQHDTRHGSQGSSGQQHHSTPDGRYPQRDRRTGTELWLEELEQETTGTAGASGGKS